MSIAQSSGWENNIRIKINAKSLGFDNNVWFTGEYRNRWNNENRHYSKHWQGTLGTSAFDNRLVYGAGYRYIIANKRIEHRLSIFFTPKINYKNFKVAFKNKFEYRSREQRPNEFRYRITPKVSYTFKLNNNFKITPYLANQVTYSFTQGKWSGNKVDTGIAFKITKYFQIKPFFEYQHNITQDRKNESRWGLTTTFIF